MLSHVASSFGLLSNFWCLYRIFLGKAIQSSSEITNNWQLVASQEYREQLDDTILDETDGSKDLY